MLATLIAALVAAGSYTPANGATSTPVAGGKDMVQCFKAAPTLELAVHGPGRGALQLFLEAAKSGAVAKGRIDVAVDNKTKTVTLRAKANRRYVGGENVLAGPLSYRFGVGAGEHRVRVSFPAGALGCVAVSGLELAPATPAPVVAKSDPVVEPVLEPVAPPIEPPQPQPESQSVAAAAEAPVAPPALEPAIEEAPQVTAHAEPAIDHSTAALSPAPRLGPFVAGVLPRGDLKAATAAGLMLEVPTAALGLPGTFHLGGAMFELMGNFTVAVSPLRQQSAVSIPNASTGIPPGDTNLIQRSFVIPLELGITARFDLGWPVRPYAGVALASDIVRTQLEAYGRTYQQNDMSFGIAIRGGGYVPLGPGGLVAEVLYREVGSNLGPLASVGESTLAVFNLQVGYLFTL